MLACQCHSLLLISCPIPAFHVSCLVLLCVHCFSHLLSPSCFGPVGQSPQYLLDCQFHALLLIRCLMSAFHVFCLFPYICCRPYHVECTGSLPTSEVKRHRARLVLGWGTAWEHPRVLPAFLRRHDMTRVTRVVCVARFVCRAGEQRAFS